MPHNGYAFDRWILDDVPAAVTEATGLVVSELFITGLSMGGYGAMRLGALYPERFRSFSGLSSITDRAQLALFVEEPIKTYRQVDPANESVLSLMVRNRDTLPPLPLRLRA